VQAQETEKLRARMRIIGLPQDRPYASQDRKFRCAPVGGMAVDPEAHQLVLEAQASGLTRWRCC
jgi:hypothetical protein